jgi:hypothetical protein
LCPEISLQHHRLSIPPVKNSFVMLCANIELALYYGKRAGQI